MSTFTLVSLCQRNLNLVQQYDYFHFLKQRHHKTQVENTVKGHNADSNNAVVCLGRVNQTCCLS